MWHTKDRFPDGFKWERVEDLANYRIGVARGYSYGEVFDAAFATGNYTVVEAALTSQLFKMLGKNRIDIALANDAVGYTLALEHAPDRSIVPAAKEIEVEVHYMAFSKKSPAARLVPEINKILAQLRKEGITAGIFGKPAP